MPGDAVLEEKAGWRGATKETLYGSSTAEQRSQTAFSSKILRTAGLLAGSFVVVAVIARWGDIPATPADDRHHSLPAKTPRRRTPIILKRRPNPFLSGISAAIGLFSARMFDLVKPQIATAADKLTHLRRFL